MDRIPIAIHRCETSSVDRVPSPDDLGFGRVFTDHMMSVTWKRGEGFRDARIGPLEDLRLSPAAVALHYGQMVFEGLKAYRTADDKIYLFRWQKNAERMRKSCERIMMTCVDEDLFGRAIKTLVLLEQGFIPRAPGCSLYVRPNIIATDRYLGVHPADEHLFYVMASPVGAYYREGFGPVSILVEEEDVRVVRGGLGEAKTAANYVHSLRAQARAAAKGFTQVLWLDALERRYVEEVGTMNIFFVIKDELITPPLAGTILAGVTRDSVITIARHFGVKVTERPITMDEVVTTIEDGSMQECFGTGTAAVISPVGVMSYKGRQYTVGGNKTGPLARRFYDYITRLQHGEEEDLFGWIDRIDQLDPEDVAHASHVGPARVP